MFKNLVALVTGGASGLGNAVVKRFAKKGARVVFCDLPHKDGNQIANEIGENVHFIPADVTSNEDVGNLMKQIESKYGGLNAVVNCAGIAHAYAIYNFNTNKPASAEDFFEVFRVNLIGTYNVTRQSADLIDKNIADDRNYRGVIINTAGVEAIRGIQCQTATAAASNGIIQMTKPLAQEYSERGIRVVTIMTGFVHSPYTESIPMEVQWVIQKKCMLAPNQFAEPDAFAHIAEKVVVCRHINGTTIDMSTGLDMGTRVF